MVAYKQVPMGTRTSAGLFFFFQCAVAKFKSKWAISMLTIASRSISRLKKYWYISNIDISPSPHIFRYILWPTTWIHTIYTIYTWIYYQYIPEYTTTLIHTIYTIYIHEYLNILEISTIIYHFYTYIQPEGWTNESSLQVCWTNECKQSVGMLNSRTFQPWRPTGSARTTASNSGSMLHILHPSKQSCSKTGL